MDRCALFVDAGYVLAQGAQAVHGTRNRDSVSWDYAGLLKLLGGLSRDRTGLPLLRCYWYDTAAEGGRATEHETLADVPGLKLRLSKARPNRKEGVEAEIRKDLTALARNRAVSDAVIVSAEEDLAPVIAEVQDLGLRAILLHISADGSWAISRPLRQECDDIIDISAGHLRPYVDLIQGAEPVVADVLSGGGYRELPVGATSPGSMQPAIAAPVPQLYSSPVAADFERLGQPQLAHVSRDQSAPPQQDAPRFSPPASGSDAAQAAQGTRRADEPPAPPASFQAPDPARQPASQLQGQPGYGQNGYGGGGAHANNGQGRGAPVGIGQQGMTVPPPSGPNGMPAMNGVPQADPPAGLGHAQNGVPPAGVPQNGVPQNGLPQNGLPQAGFGAGAGQQAGSGMPSALHGMPQGGQGLQPGDMMPSVHGLHSSDQGPQHGTQSGQVPAAPDRGAGQRYGSALGQGGQLGQGMTGGAQGYQPGPPAGGIGQPGQGLSSGPGPQPGAGLPPQGPPRQVPGAGLAQPGQNGLAAGEPLRPGAPQRQSPPANGMPYPPDRPVQFGPPQPGQFGPAGGYPATGYGSPRHDSQQQAPVPQPPPVAISVGEAVQSAHAEGFGFGEAVARDAPALWLEAVLARKPRMPSDLEARLLQGSALPIDSLLHDEVRHALRRGFWDALERSRH